jgi:hypothetical protein
VQDAFLRGSLRLPYRRVPVASDPGMVQRGPFDADLDATARALDAWLDGIDEAAESVAAELESAGSAVVLCDIDALGILAAAQAGIPSVLIENFRWDWIYAELPEATDALRDAARRIGAIYRRADLHLQVAPVCDPVERAVKIDLPVARAARASRDEARAELGLGPAERVVLVTMGGVPGEEPPLDALWRRSDLTFVLTGAARTERLRNVLRLAQSEPLYLPDLVRASDGVVAKLGYSTAAETWREGRPMMRVTRPLWPETPAMSLWAARNVPGFEIDDSALRSGEWMARLDELLALPWGPAHGRAGQDEVAERILALVG